MFPYHNYNEPQPDKKIIIIIKINQYFGKMLDMSGDSERCTQKEETLVVH